MIKKPIKSFLKNNRIAFNILAGIIFLYLKFVCFTTKWQLIWPKNFSKKKFLQSKGVVFVIWHNRLAFSLKIFEKSANTAGLVSSHFDGKIIAKVIKLWGKLVISGSTNKNSIRALRQIIEGLKKDYNIVITPDGPRGPIYRINSVISKISHNYNKKIIPVSCAASNYFNLNSWDKMIIPKPFGKVIITFGEEFIASGDEVKDNLKLEETLMELTNMSESMINKK